MKLGILVNTDRHPDHLIGITKSALAKGHEVIIFIMDDGTYLLKDPAVQGLCSLRNVSMNFCTHNARQLGNMSDNFPDNMTAGSQINNASMQHWADRVIVL